jgi:pimeloyl-ACP methyl ester carboxylesterase
VLLIPGWKDDDAVMQPLAACLRASGWPQSHVRAISFRDPCGGNAGHAREIAGSVASLQQASGAASIVAVAHSMGGLALRRYLADHHDTPVTRAITLATPHSGTWIAWLGWGDGARDMRPGSAFLRELHAHPLPPHVRMVCLRAPLDTRLVPRASAWLDGVECLTLPAAGHRRILSQRSVCERVVELVSADE